jgi:hypothetical protein
VTIDVDSRTGDWVSLRVRDGHHVTAWSNPIYVDDAIR